MCSVKFAVCSDAGKIRHNGKRTPAKTIPAFSQTAKAGCSFDAPDDALCAAAQNERGHRLRKTGITGRSVRLL